MLEMAKQIGVDIHRRAIEYCDEKTKSFGEVVAHIASSVEGDHILWATCTSPLVFPQHYQNAIKLYFKNVKNGKFDSLASFERIKRYLWDGNGPINYTLGKKHVPSQELPELYIVTDGILLAPRIKMIEWNYFHGKNPYKLFLDKKTSVDVDDHLDLLCARAWLDVDETVSHIIPFQLEYL
jgi:N-acylneuraminate cytidylyltransferase